MTLEELNALRDTYSFPSGVQIRLPDEGETITSTRPGEVAFYEAAFPAGLRFPLHSTIRLILQFLQYLPSPARSQRLEKHCLLYGVVAGWLYFKAKNKKVLLGGYPSNVKGWKSKFFFVSGDDWTAGDNLSSREAPNSSSDVGESQNPHEQARRESPSRDDSIECLGSIITELRSSNPSSDSCSDSSLPVELESDDWREARETAGASSGTPVPAKGVVIGDKRAGESITSSPSKKGKADDGSKGKGVDSGPEGKKKATSSSKASAAPTATSSCPGEGTSANLGTVPGPTPSILGSPSVAERLLWGVIPPADKEKVEKLTLDQTATKLFHVIGQVLFEVLLIFPVARLQKFAAVLEQQLAESRAREQQANDELTKMKSDRDSLADKLERSGVLVNELRGALDKAKESAVEEFKSSSEFMVAVEDSASKYFNEGFDFCKVQLRRHHPDLAIDLEGTVVDQDLLAEQDEAAEEREKENLGENKGCCVSYYFNVNGDHELGYENSLGDAKLATSLTAIRTPVIL
ncbi:hypothetical protein Acr_00g0036920 [Actinidia rufa]|uniref:Uncharacterized protein n=1 Tax=Actinidia rufa TaxID=165716 RepID=A0A7J0DHU8_9ERIC|nr:hypothetical protein Acr_00g0036920 [Actinidia rufa]